MMDDRHYKHTTHSSPTRRPSRPGDQGREGATDVCERVGGSTSPGSGMHAAAYFRGNKNRRNVLTDMLFSDMRSGRLTSGYRFVQPIYRLSDIV